MKRCTAAYSVITVWNRTTFNNPLLRIKLNTMKLLIKQVKLGQEVLIQ